MAEIISVASTKGGVGKTTTAINLSASLATLGYRTLLIDFDPQGSISRSFGYNKIDKRPGGFDILHDTLSIYKVIYPTVQKNLEFMPSIVRSSEILESVGSTNFETYLKTALAEIKEEYDFVLIDCPSALNSQNLPALIASDSVIVPIQCEYFAFQALGTALKFIRQIEREKNPSLRYRGFLITMVDYRNKLSSMIIDRLRLNLRGMVFNTVIHRNVKLAEAPLYGLPAILLDRTCKGATCYMELAQEILRQNLLDSENHISSLGSTQTIYENKE